jgi:hypothetical protein
LGLRTTLSQPLSRKQCLMSSLTLIPIGYPSPKKNWNPVTPMRISDFQAHRLLKTLPLEFIMLSQRLSLRALSIFPANFVNCFTCKTNTPSKIRRTCINPLRVVLIAFWAKLVTQLVATLVKHLSSHIKIAICVYTVVVSAQHCF